MLFRSVFGRDRHLAGVPYAGTLGKEAEDWVKEMADREKEVGEKTLAIRQQRVDRWNKRHREAPVYGPDKGRVRYRHPPNRSSTLDPGWAGPWEVRSWVGETNYLLWTGSREVAAHASMMKDSDDPGLGPQWRPCPMSGSRREQRLTTIKASQSTKRTAFCSIEYEVGNTNSSLGGKATGKRMTLGSP